jgi:hypothetical protein
MAKVNPIPLPSAPGPGGKPGGLAEKIWNMIVASEVKGLSMLLEPFAHAIRFALESTVEDFEDQAADFARPLLTELANSDALPAWARKYFSDLLTPKHAIQLAAIIPIVMAVLGALAMAVMGAVIQLVQYAVNRVTDPFRVPFDVAWINGRRKTADDKIVHGDLFDQGLSNERIAAMGEALEKRLQIQDIGQLVLRGEMSSDAAVGELYNQGWKREHAQAVMKLLQIIPVPGDLISMAVREAWDDGFAALAGTDADLPSEFVEWAGKQGLSPDWCKRYWRSHWQLPSAQMGFEMLHRGAIGPTDLDKLLKALDISPGWRDKLVQIAYNLPTRVDTRRAYQQGVIGETEVHDVYVALGYEEKWAKILTDWTVIAYAPEEKDVTVADIRTGLQKGMLTEAEATDYLKSLDVGDEAIGFYIAQARFARAAALKETRVKAIENKFVSGKFDRAAAASALTALALPSAEIEINLDAWQAEREAKTRQPSFSELRGFYLDDLIPADQFQRETKALGYDDDDIALYLRSADADKERAAKAEAERAQNEQERLAKAEKATAYQKLVADANAKIAEQRAAITNAQAALNAGLSDAKMREAENAIDQLDEEIAAERKIIATFRAQSGAAKNSLNAKISESLRNSLDAQIGDAQTAISETNQSIAALDTQIAQAKLAALTAASDEEKSALKTSIAEMQVEIAIDREDVEARQLTITNARNQMRNYISDDERQALEATIRDADEAIAKSSTSIADYQAQQATLKLQIAQALNSDQRAALSQAIDDARKRIAELQVTRAEARVEG